MAEAAARDAELAGLLGDAFRSQADGGQWAVAAVAISGGRRAAWCHGATPQSAFELASVTKTFTALLLAVLAVQQRVALDDLLAAYLPAAAGASTRLVDLATHSAGYPRLPGAIARYMLSRDPYARLTDRQIDREVQRLSRQLRAASYPASYSYSNLGFGVLSRALAAAGGRSFGELLTAEVLRPLGLAVTLDTDEGPDRLPGHSSNGRRTPPWHNPALPGAGCLWASIDQLGDYLAAHLHPERTLLHQAIELALQPRQPMPSPASQVCLGWMRRETGHSRVHWHNGSTYGFGSFVALDRQHDAAVGALINRRRPAGLDAVAMSVLRHMASRPAGA
jgi:serine-type D-Ala-D-Ala carboxypeptidase/endopeptidase